MNLYENLHSLLESGKSLYKLVDETIVYSDIFISKNCRHLKHIFYTLEGKKKILSLGNLAIDITSEYLDSTIINNSPTPSGYKWGCDIKILSCKLSMFGTYSSKQACESTCTPPSPPPPPSPIPTLIKPITILQSYECINTADPLNPNASYLGFGCGFSSYKIVNIVIMILIGIVYY